MKHTFPGGLEDPKEIAAKIIAENSAINVETTLVDIKMIVAYAKKKMRFNATLASVVAELKVQAKNVQK